MMYNSGHYGASFEITDKMDSPGGQYAGSVTDDEVIVVREPQYHKSRER